jgi:secreted trypsin-like serine protease
VQPNIVGGTAPTQNYPAGAKVSLNYDAPSHNVIGWFTCGATLVFANVIVTSAHCVTDPPAPIGTAEYAKILARFPDIQAQALPIPTKDKQFYVHVGSDDRTAGVRANAYTVWVDPEWDWATGPNPVNDIAVLKLDTALDIQTVPLGAGSLKPGAEVFGLG